MVQDKEKYGYNYIDIKVKTQNFSPFKVEKIVYDDYLGIDKIFKDDSYFIEFTVFSGLLSSGYYLFTNYEKGIEYAFQAHTLQGDKKKFKV
ncbi:MAG: hypothetical protein U9O66_04000 [Patescibacteria group bacterium]|nr:hypothetical protein [Patescibacteria group bacterium]